LRSPDVQFFADDPLRFFRVMHFVGRFNAFVDAELFEMCRKMDISAISRERVEQELYKLFLYSRLPSRGFRFMQDCGRLHEWFAEIAALTDVKQLPQWHPEGSVFEHTMQALDAAAEHIRRNNSAEIVLSNKNSMSNFDSAGDKESVDTAIVLLLAALCHDCGKAVSTDAQTLKSHGHDIAGVDCARALLQRIIGSKKIHKKVLGLVRYHMVPLNFIINNASNKAYRVFSVKLARCQVSIKMLVALAYADSAGRNGANTMPLNYCVSSCCVSQCCNQKDSTQRVDEFAQRARDAGVFDGPVQPLVQGKDVLGLYGEGPIIGEVVAYAYEIQVEKGIVDKAVLLSLIEKKYKRERI
jgi:tRNA nucleotidyltransferase (CCA-adding enzyme)